MSAYNGSLVYDVAAVTVSISLHHKKVIEDHKPRDTFCYFYKVETLKSNTYWLDRQIKKEESLKGKASADIASRN